MQHGCIVIILKRDIPELDVINSTVDCCGVAGTYGYKKEKYAIASQVGEPLFDFYRSIGGPLAICDSETCRWQISHATGIPAVHPIEILAVSLGFSGNGILEKLHAT